MRNPTPNYDLIREAMNTIADIPAEKFGLDQIVSMTGGIVVGDTSYWLAMSPEWQARGLSVQRGGGIYLNGEYRGCRCALSDLFNLGASLATVLFGQRRGHELELTISDKELLIGRINFYFNEHGLRPLNIPTSKRK